MFSSVVEWRSCRAMPCRSIDTTDRAHRTRAHTRAPHIHYTFNLLVCFTRKSSHARTRACLCSCSRLTVSFRLDPTFDPDDPIYDPSFVFLRIRRVPTTRPDMPNEWQIVAIGAPCGGRSGRSEETLAGCDIYDFVSDETATAIAKASVPSSGDLLKVKKGKSKSVGGKHATDWTKISPYIEYTKKFIQRISLILSRGALPSLPPNSPCQRLRSPYFPILTIGIRHSGPPERSGREWTQAA
jgi:hypothetical protein